MSVWSAERFTSGMKLAQPRHSIQVARTSYINYTISTSEHCGADIPGLSRNWGKTVYSSTLGVLMDVRLKKLVCRKFSILFLLRCPIHRKRLFNVSTCSYQLESSHVLYLFATNVQFVFMTECCARRPVWEHVNMTLQNFQVQLRWVHTSVFILVAKMEWAVQLYNTRQIYTSFATLSFLSRQKNSSNSLEEGLVICQQISNNKFSHWKIHYCDFFVQPKL